MDKTDKNARKPEKIESHYVNLQNRNRFLVDDVTKQVVVTLAFFEQQNVDCLTNMIDKSALETSKNTIKTRKKHPKNRKPTTGKSSGSSFTKNRSQKRSSASTRDVIGCCWSSAPVGNSNATCRWVALASQNFRWSTPDWFSISCAGTQKPRRRFSHGERKQVSVAGCWARQTWPRGHGQASGEASDDDVIGRVRRTGRQSSTLHKACKCKVPFFKIRFGESKEVFC